MPTKTLPPGKTQANWIIRKELKDWVDREAARRDMRPAYVIEECIKIMRETTQPEVKP